MNSSWEYPDANHYWLLNAHVPTQLIAADETHPNSYEALTCCHLEVVAGKLSQIRQVDRFPQEFVPDSTLPAVDLERRLLLPGFVDLHTHLDKGHIWPRSPNPDGTFTSAITATKADAQFFYAARDLYRRMDFGLRCSYAHGTVAIRTHIDVFGQQAKIGFEVFTELRDEWRDRIQLQGACLVSTDEYLTPSGIALADQMAEIGGILGGVAYWHDNLEAELRQLLTLAQARQLPVDVHVDENGNPNSEALRLLAQVAQELDFSLPIICGHCCSLGVQAPERVQDTLNLVSQSPMGIVSLPLCNLYLQGRHPLEQPHWRGIPPLAAIHEAHIPLAFANDNCRDPFHAFGDHDMLEVLTQTLCIGQLLPPYDRWCASVTQVPATLMGLTSQGIGQLQVGQPADWNLFSARFFSELFARAQGDRLIIRRGKVVDAPLPDYRELDDLMA